MWAKWLGPGPTASSLATATAVVVVAIAAVAWLWRRRVRQPAYLEFGLLLVLPCRRRAGITCSCWPLRSSVVDRFRNASLWRIITAVAFAFMSFTIFDLPDARFTRG